MKHLVIGRGEVGKALIEVLSEKYDVSSVDKGESLSSAFDVIHVCIPYSKGFRRAVADYWHHYKTVSGLAIIHSTVPVGTSSWFSAVHSPIRGVHPNLAQGIRTFTKYFGGPRAVEAAVIFARLGIPVATTLRAENTEAMKLWDTTYYGWAIVFEKAVKAYCDRHGLDFDLVYRSANQSYNEGYAKLGMPDVQRPVLEHRPGGIGGHCVIPNAEILHGDIADFILYKNTEYNQEKEAA